MEDKGQPPGNSEFGGRRKANGVWKQSTLISLTLEFMVSKSAFTLTSHEIKI